MNEMQQQAIKRLTEKNQHFISELEKRLKALTRHYEGYDPFEKEFNELMSKMDRANSHLPFVPYNNYYCLRNDDFAMPTRPFIVDDYLGYGSNEFYMLSEEYMDKLEATLSSRADRLRSTLESNAEDIENLINSILAANSITKRLSGLQEKLQELEMITKYYWFPQSIVKEEYSNRGQFLLPTSLSLSSPQYALPFHRDLMVRFIPLFRTRNLHLKILKDTKFALEYINEYLPFAELVPLKEDGGVHFHNINTNSPKDIQIGSENTFEGEINIGNEEVK